MVRLGPRNGCGHALLALLLAAAAARVAADPAVCL
jgi:hypothetical protein